MLRVVRFASGLFATTVLAGCPGGADLENPNQYPPPLTGDGGPDNGGTPFGLPDAGCNYVEILSRSCTLGGCHRSPIPASGLDLTPNEGLLGRVYNQPAQHGAIVCDPTTLQVCMPPTVTCASCASCATGDLLVNATTPAESWLLKKIQAALPGTGMSVDMGCGFAMPEPSNDFVYTDADKTCLEAMVAAFAASGGP